MSTLSRLGALLSRHAGIYASGSALMLVLGLANVAVLTRLLSPSAYGRLAVFIFFAALLTIIYNMGSLQGCFRWAYGAGADDGDDEGDEDLDDRERGLEEGIQRRRALGTGLILTAIIAAAGSLIVVVNASPLARLLTGDPADADLVRLAAASAAAGALSRFVSNVPRLERRPVAYVLLFSLRPIFALGIAVPLVANGAGIRGVLVGLAIGTAAAVLVTLIFTRGSYALAFMPWGIPIIIRRGALVVPLVISNFVVQQGDIFLLSRFASDADLGFYRVAGRVGASISYLVGAITMAWGPLGRTPLAAAAREERGTEVGARLITYFSLWCVWALLVLSVAADALVHIAGPDYAEASSLIPLLGLSFATNGLAVIVYRGTAFPHRRRKYVSLNVLAALLFIPTSLVLMPALDAYGAALSVALAGALITTGLLIFSHRSTKPTRIEYRRIGAAIALAGACYGLERALSIPAGDLRPAVGVASVLAFPALLVAFKVFPLSEAKSLFQVLKSAFDPRGSRAVADEMLERVPQPQREFLGRVLDQGSVQGLAGARRMNRAELLRFVRILRRVGDIGQPSETDYEIGAYLLSDETVAQRDAMGKRLWKGNAIDALDLDALQNVYDLLRAARRKQPTPEPPEPPLESSPDRDRAGWSGP